MAMGTPIAYLRKSRIVADRPGTVSHAQQEDAVRALAARHGFELRPDHILEDWGKSGGEGKERKRTEYQRLKAAVEAGAVTDVFAFDQSRLTRSTREWAELAELCKARGVQVHLVNGGTKDFASADGRMTAGILAQIATAERERAVERASDAIARRKARGERLGPPAYGIPLTRRDGTVVGDGDDPAAVVAAFREAGSFNGAATLLNRRGIPPKAASRRQGPRAEGEPAAPPPIWRSLAVRRVIEREAPALIPPNGRIGSRTVGRFALAGLMRCGGTVTRPGASDPEPCGGILTAANRPGRPSPIYRCQRSWTDPSHSRPASVSEATVLPWIREEASRLAAPDQLEVPEDPYDDSEERGALLALRGKVADAVIDAGIADLDARRAARGQYRAHIVEVPTLDWSWSPDAINGVLRAMWRVVRLGPDQRPTEADWTVPEWRRDDPLPVEAAG